MFNYWEALYKEFLKVVQGTTVIVHILKVWLLLFAMSSLRFHFITKKRYEKENFKLKRPHSVILFTVSSSCASECFSHLLLQNSIIQDHSFLPCYFLIFSFFLYLFVIFSLFPYFYYFLFYSHSFHLHFRSLKDHHFVLVSHSSGSSSTFPASVPVFPCSFLFCPEDVPPKCSCPYIKPHILEDHNLDECNSS